MLNYILYNFIPFFDHVHPKFDLRSVHATMLLSAYVIPGDPYVYLVLERFAKLIDGQLLKFKNLPRKFLRSMKSKIKEVTWIRISSLDNI